MEIQFIADQVKKRRIVVLAEEELYDFTDEELQLIYQCRDDEDNAQSPIGKRRNIPVRGQQQIYQDGMEERAESENSDTESALQDNWDHFNNGFLEDADHDHESIGMMSSMSHSDFPETEFCDYYSDNVKYIQIVASPFKEREQSSKNQTDQEQQNQSQKKRIVPDPWLSNTNYCMESDESFEEQDTEPYHSSSNTDTPQNLSIRNKISAFGNKWLNLPSLLNYTIK